MLINKVKMKIKCDCGKFLKKGIVQIKKKNVEAMVCPKCNFVTLTLEQAKQYSKLKDMHKIVDAERKIIKIGNSMGLTLPDRLQEFGAKVRKNVRTEALDFKSFKVEFVE